MARRSNAEEFLARFVAVLANASGHAKRTITPQDVLGRPFRKDWEEAMAKKEANEIERRLAEKDAERKRIILVEH